MSDKKKITRFRKQRANDLRTIARTLEGVFGSERGALNIKTTPLITAAKNLENGLIGNRMMKGNIWGYEILNFKLPVETLRHIRPKGINKIELTLNMRLEADSDDWGTLNDPLLSLNFNVVLKAITNKSNYLCFHIDKHDMSKFSAEPHPIYHIQYNPKPKSVSDSDFDYGNILHFDTPRIMHQPLDLVLGIGFLISNFAPSKWNKLIEDKFFKKTYIEYQKNILKPYNHSFANHWNPMNSEDITWNATNHICPFIV